MADGCRAAEYDERRALVLVAAFFRPERCKARATADRLCNVRAGPFPSPDTEPDADNGYVNLPALGPDGDEEDEDGGGDGITTRGGRG